MKKGGQISRAQRSDRGRVRPTAGPGGRESRRKARRSEAAAPLPANGANWTTSDPPSSRGAELPLLSYPYGARLHLRICESGSSRKVKPALRANTSGDEQK